MIRKLATILSTAAALALLGVTPAQAAPSAVIHCSTHVHMNWAGKEASIRVVSNHTNSARVHSLIAYYIDHGHTTESLTFIPIGPVIKLGGHNWVKFRTWQSGTECTPWALQGDL